MKKKTFRVTIVTGMYDESSCVHVSAYTKEEARKLAIKKMSNYQFAHCKQLIVAETFPATYFRQIPYVGKKG